MTTDPSPGNVLDIDDPGDETLARFRYQCSAAAINCIRLILDVHDVVAVICENFEDILVERLDGTFVGLQIKTRRLDLNPFTATEAVIVKSLGRFCMLDSQFPGKFQKFDFSTNHSFWRKKENEKNLPWVLDALKERQSIKHLPKTNFMRRFVHSICAETDLPAEQVIQTLCKTVLNSRTEAIEGIDHRVREAVGQCPVASDLSFSQVAKVAEELVNMCFQASSKKTTGDISDLYAAGLEFSEIVKGRSLAGKCISKKRVENIINAHCVVGESLQLSGLVPISSLPTHLATMIQKLDKGGLQNSRIDELSDLVMSFQHLLLQWVRKYGSEIAEERYQNLLAKVKFDCIEAQVVVENSDTQYAPQMYVELIQRLRDRVDDAHDELHGCNKEHLMGAAGMLTQQCKAWWSPKFEIEEA